MDTQVLSEIYYCQKKKILFMFFWYLYILPINSQMTLVTAGLDANICLWDVVTHSPKKELKGHEKGVYCYNKR